MDEEVSHNLLESQLIDAINESIQNHIYSNATFLAERLLAEKDCEESRSLLADCYMAENQHYKVVYILKDCRSDANRYKFAESCIKINKFKEGEKALLGEEVMKPNKNYDVVPNGSYGIYLLGIIMQKQQRYSEAKEYFYRALEANPTLWSAYEKLSKLGENILPNRVFTEARMKSYEIKNKKTTAPRKRLTREEKPSQSNSLLRRKMSGNSESSFSDISVLLKKLADANYNLAMYNSVEAIQEFNRLPKNHYNTGWVLCSIGKAYMEIVKYQQAIKYYEQAYQLEPYRLEGVGYYSSCLWHLKKQVQLCNLAHQSLEKTLYSPEAWIAAGNCFSLQKDYDQAIKFFSRAIQLSPNNSYALCLCGHEYVVNEDFTRAKKMFESALNYDARHYYAWWGLGNIAYKQERYEKASDNFKRAMEINKKNPVLYSFMAITKAANREFTEALEYFQQSQKLDSKNGLNRFQKANTLVKLEKYDEAVRELECMQSIIPKEPQIPLLLGKIYKKLNKIEKAHYYFSMALDLESKDAQKIKGFIESLHTGNESEEMEI